jgi:hypothetical protein
MGQHEWLDRICHFLLVNMGTSEQTSQKLLAHIFHLNGPRYC